LVDATRPSRLLKPVEIGNIRYERVVIAGQEKMKQWKVASGNGVHVAGRYPQGYATLSSTLYFCFRSRPWAIAEKVVFFAGSDGCERDLDGMPSWWIERFW